MRSRLARTPARIGYAHPATTRGSTNPSAASGVRNSIDPTRVSHLRVRYPFRRHTRSGLCCPQGAPQTTSASADISPCAKLRTISPNRSLPSASSWLRNHSNSSILVLTTALPPHGSSNTSVRLTRWSPKSKDPPPHTPQEWTPLYPTEGRECPGQRDTRPRCATAMRWIRDRVGLARPTVPFQRVSVARDIADLPVL